MSITVKELKKRLDGWPETDRGGEDTEVWMMTGENLSSPVTAITRLNYCDILFEVEQEKFSEWEIKV